MRNHKPTKIPSQAVSVATPPLALNIQDAARVCGVASWTVRQSILLGELRAKRAGRAYIILLSDLQNWVEQLQDVKPSSAPSILARKKGHE